MRDLTTGSLARHLAVLGTHIGLGSVLQTVRLMVDLYFVAALGGVAVAGVGAVSTIVIFNIGLSQVLSVGTSSLISHRAGRRDRAEIVNFFHHSFSAACLCSVILLLVGYSLVPFYLEWIAADASVAAAARTFLLAYLPGLALQLPTAVLLGSLRGSGETGAILRTQGISLATNIVLAPVLIMSLGVAGAGLASSLSIALGLGLLLRIWWRKSSGAFSLSRLMKPQWSTWKQLLGVGVPAGGEYFVLYCYMAIVYWAAGHWGTAPQAAVGIGSRLIQTMVVPSFAVAYAAAPIAGQNFGAANFERTRMTFMTALLIVGVITSLTTALCEWQAPALMKFFTTDPAVLSLGVEFVRVIACSFIAQGIVQTCFSLFQAIGRTLPVLVSAVTQLAVFAIPLPWLVSAQDTPAHLWYWATISVCLQAAFSLWLLNRSWRLVGRPGRCVTS